MEHYESIDEAKVDGHRLQEMGEIHSRREPYSDHRIVLAEE